jgi:hypothetical protein
MANVRPCAGPLSKSVLPQHRHAPDLGEGILGGVVDGHSAFLHQLFLMAIVPPLSA